MNERLAAILAKIPIVPLAFLGIGWVAYDSYDFFYGDTSPLITMRNQLKSAQDENKKIAERIKKNQEFASTLEKKRRELIDLGRRLEEIKAGLSSDVDVPTFIRSINTEAKRAGLDIQSVNPEVAVAKDSFSEQSFRINYSGFYVQLLIFLERLMSSKSVLNFEEFDLKSQGATSARFVQLSGLLRIKTYRYLATDADQIAEMITQPVEDLLKSPMTGASSGTAKGK